jgi:hypothetical protein
MVEPSIYDQLAKEPLSDLTITQLNSGSSVTAIDAATLNYWRGPITLHRIAGSSRTYPHGLPIPEASGIESATVADAGSATMKPTGSEIWEIQAIDSTADVMYSLYDGASVVQLVASPSAAPFIPTSPLFLTPTLYLIISNSSGGEATVGLAYHKVSL